MNSLVNEHAISQIKKIYRIKKKEILSRLKEFEKLWSDGNDEEIFTELAFCILTPQSKAKSCWDAIVKLKEQNLLLNGNTRQIKQGLTRVRFKNKKAEYIVKARKLFTPPLLPPLIRGGWGGVELNKEVPEGFNHRVSIKPFLSKFTDIYECREWLVQNIKGIGYKEASHFLRNIGFGEKIAILDRHILKNLNQLGVIEEIPKTISRAKYIWIEEKMKGFARQIDILISHLDLLLWYKETGEIFK
jgi:N-glycosylase/DNA lyase